MKISLLNVEKDSQGVSANKEIIQLSGEKAPQEFIQAKQTGDNNSSIASPNISSPNIAVSNKDKTQTFGNEPHTEQLRAKQIDLGSGEAKVQNDSQVGNTSQATNQSQTPTEATTSKATSNAQTNTQNLTQASNSPGANTSMGIASGDKSTAPGTQKAAAISADSPGEILEELKNTRPTQVVGAYAQAQSASTQAFEHQKQQLQESIPQIPIPTGLPASESPQPQKAAEKVASQAAASKEIPEPQLGATKPTPKGLSNSGTKHNIPVPESPPAPPITATHLASQKAEGAQKGESDPALSKSAQNALAGIHLNSSRISTHAPQSPHVDMSGEADPSQMDLTTAQSTQQVRGGKNQAAQGIDRDFGESRISPQASNGVIKANKELSAIGGVGGKGGANPLLTGEVAGSLDQSLTPYLREKIGPEQEKYQVGKNKFDLDSANARADTDNQISELTAQSKQKQLEQRHSAQLEVAQHKQEWQTELDNAQIDYQQKAQQATQEQLHKIGGEKTKGETEAAKHLEDASRKAEAEKHKAERQTAEKKQQAQKESGGFFGWVKSAAKALIDGVKQAVNYIYENLRKVVKAIFEAAKKLANAAIDLARNAIIALIQSYGAILKALVKVAFLAFPAIAQKITAKIDQVINKAVQAVNAIADSLQKSISLVLDSLASFLDQIFGLLQSLYNGILTAIGMVINGEIKELLAKVKDLISAAQAAPPQFETAALEELLGGNLDQPLSNGELSQAAAMGIKVPNTEDGTNPQAGKADLPSPPWTTENVGVDSVENNM